MKPVPMRIFMGLRNDWSIKLRSSRSILLIPLLIGLAGLIGTAKSSAPDGEDLGHGYTRQGSNIFFQGKQIDIEGKHDLRQFAQSVGHELTLCGHVDATSFEVLNESYTKDKNKAYYKWVSPGRFWVIELKAADPQSFEALNFAHAIDKNSIWYLDQAIAGSEPSTVEVIDNRIVKDSQSVYISGQPARHLDATTFRNIGSAYFADKNGIYWGDQRIQGAKPDSFRVLKNSFVGVDDKTVYRSGQPLPHIEPTSCNLILHDPYGYQVISDKNGVYLNGLQFVHASPDKLKMHDNLTGQSGDYLFLVDTYHGTPITIYRESGYLTVETILYKRGTFKPLATINGIVEGTTIARTKLLPAPGETKIKPVPDWQIELFKRPEIARKIRKAAERFLPME